MGQQEESDQAMVTAVYSGDVDVLKELISKGVNPNIKGYSDQPLLVCAAGSDKVEVLRYLLEDVHIPTEVHDKCGHTALLSAASRGSLDAVKYLVSAGVNVQARTALGETALHLSARTESVETFKFLQDSGIPIDAVDIRGRNALHHAAVFSCPKMVEYILQGGWLPVDCQDKNGQTPLMLTADFPRNEKDGVIHIDWFSSADDFVNPVIKLLLEAGADLSIKDVLGRTTLHRTLGNEDNFGFLWKKCPDFTHSVDKIGQTPIHRALSAFRYHYDMRDVVRALLIAGADAKSCDKAGRTPLRIAADKDCPGVVQSLIKAGADTSCYEKDVLTKILHGVVWKDDFELTKRILAEGADVNGRNSFRRDPPSEEISHTITCLGCYETCDRVYSDLSGQSPLFEALRSVNMVILLIDAGADVNFKDDHGWSPLQKAFYDGNIESVEVLLNAGADPNITDDCGVSLLHILSTKPGNLGRFSKIRERLIQCGAKVNATDHNGRTPLHYAAKQGNWQCIRSFLDAGADINSTDVNGATPLLMVAYRNFYQVAQLLIDAGADITASDKDGQTIIHRAVQLGNTAAVDYLVNKWPSTLGCDNHGNTILHFAARTRNNRVSCIDHILKMESTRKQVSVDEKNEEGQTPLALVVQHGLQWNSVQDEVRTLLAAGANPNVKDNNGKTPLHTASSSGDVKVMEVLIQAGVDVTSKDNIGRTALHWAAQAHSLEGLKLLLLQNAASINEQDNDGQTPLMLAAGNKDAVRLLLNEGANVNVRTHSGKTALQEAIDSGSHGAMKLIWAAGSNFLDITQESRIRAVHLAVREGDEEVVDHLHCLGMTLSECWWDPDHRMTLLHCAAQSSLKMLKQLVESGHTESGHDYKGHTPLHCAVLSANYVGTKYLLEEAHVPVDERDADGRTALMLVASSEWYYPDVYDMLEILVNAGADINAQDKDSKTAYQLAYYAWSDMTTDQLDYMQYRL